MLSRTADSYINLINFYTGEHFTANQLTQYDTTKVLPRQYKNLAESIWNWPILYKYVQPLTDSQQYVKRLCDNENIEVYVVSISHPDVMKSKSDFIRREYPFIKNVILIDSNNYQCKQLLNFDCLIDDNPDNLFGSPAHKLLFSYYWNQSFNAKYNGMVRCNDWREIYNEVMRELEAKKLVWDLEN